jgi:predicted lactoylglutathione lyase
MAQMIFVNLPVADLEAAKAFYVALGYGVDPRFSDDKATSIVISETIVVMLLTEPFFAGFCTKPVADARTVTEVRNCLSMESREAVDRLVDAAVAAGGSEPRGAMDHGFMYMRAFDDLDGHAWEIAWMDATFAEKGVADERHDEAEVMAKLEAR